MKQIAALALAGLLTAAPATAQDDGSDGLSLIEEGMMMLFRELADEIEPAIKDLATELEPQIRELAQAMGPVLKDLSELMGDLDEYHAPEKLPNGDIILRRKTKPSEPRSPGAKTGPQIEL